MTHDRRDGLQDHDMLERARRARVECEVAAAAGVTRARERELELEWIDDEGWAHRLRLEGHLWRWTATHLGPGDDKISWTTMVPGGVFVAVKSLVVRCRLPR